MEDTIKQEIPDDDSVDEEAESDEEKFIKTENVYGGDDDEESAAGAAKPSGITDNIKARFSNLLAGAKRPQERSKPGPASSKRRRTDESEESGGDDDDEADEAAADESESEESDSDTEDDSEEAESDGASKSASEPDEPEETFAVVRFPRKYDSPEEGPELDDSYLYCDFCSRYIQGDCPLHGAFHVVANTAIAADVNDSLRAKKTAPPQVSVKEPSMPGERTRVFARERISARTRFGPYEGEEVPALEASSLAWAILDKQEVDHCVDAKEPGLSSWLRYVNCARKDGQENLEAFQYQGHIYYRTNRSVAPNEELVVWAGDEMGRRRGTDDPEFVDAEAGEHSKDLNGKCPACPYVNASPLFLELHKKLCRQLQKSPIETAKPQSEQLLACLVCSQLFSDYAALSSHVAGHGEGEGGLFICYVCEKTYRDVRFLEKHLLIHSPNNPNVCRICDRGFDGRDRLDVHMRTHRKAASGKPFECTHCDQRFDKRSEQTKHLEEHNAEKLFACSECDKRFFNAHYLSRHMRTHIFVCTDCNEKFEDKEALRSHRRVHSPAERYVCLGCDRRFPTKKKMDRHLHLGCGMKPYKCTKCKMQFARQNYLKKHLRTHSGEKPHACTVCGSRFSDTSRLGRHMSVHTRERPFPCTECNKRFADRPTLRRHLLIHTGDKMYRCYECPKRFTERHHLQLHLKTHDRAKPFACLDCHRRFELKDELREHWKEHRIEKSHACDVVSNEKRPNEVEEVRVKEEVEEDEEEDEGSEVEEEEEEVKKESEPGFMFVNCDEINGQIADFAAGEVKSEPVD